VAEAVGNAVVHAFDGRDDGVITVQAEIDGPDDLVVEIAETGFGMTTIARDPRAGFGLPIIGVLADSVDADTRAVAARDDSGPPIRSWEDPQIGVAFRASETPVVDCGRKCADS